MKDTQTTTTEASTMTDTTADVTRMTTTYVGGLGEVPKMDYLTIGYDKAGAAVCEAWTRTCREADAAALFMFGPIMDHHRTFEYDGQAITLIALTADQSEAIAAGQTIFE